MRVFLLTTALAAVLAAGPAGATSLLGDSHDVNQTNVDAPTQVNTQTNVQTVTPITTNVLDQNQLQGQDQHQAQGQLQGQALDADQTQVGIQGNSQNVTFKSAKNVRQAPDLGVLPSGPCTGGSGQGTVGAAGFAFGIGVATVDENCSKLETVRVGMASDDPQIRDLAKRVYLSIEWVQDVNPEDGSPVEQHSARPTAEQTAEVTPTFYGSNR